MKYFIGITTTKQRPLSKKVLKAWLDVIDGDDYILEIIEDDMNDPKGVAYQKNELIERFLKTDCGHLFLAEDDTYPLDRHAITRYLESSGNHYSLSFKNRRFIQLDEETGESVWKWSSGVLLYFKRVVPEAIGFMREDIGKFGREHSEYSRRACHAGLTKYDFMDVTLNHYKHWYIMDFQEPAHPSNIGDDDSKTAAFANAKRLEKHNRLPEGEFYFPRLGKK